MSEQKIDSYRFNSGMEPTDEMLSQIMREAALDANERSAKAEARIASEMQRRREELKSKWKNRIDSISAL